MKGIRQKWISTLVVVCFAWLLHASTMPLAAAGAAHPTLASDQGTGFHEAVARKAVPAKTKSLLPWMLIAAGVLGATAAVLFLFMLKSYDLTGTWTFIFDGPTHETYLLTFSGTKKSGTFKFDALAFYFGTYTVDGKAFTMVLTGLPDIQFSGRFTDKDALNGDWINGGDHWTFTAMRSGAAITANPAPAGASRLLTR
jgi:hypothetical protein